MKPQHRRKAFTLIEILVVIAIIALLSAILFPVFSRARENARAKNCMSNEKQIALAILQYKEDYGRRFPINPNCAGCDGWTSNIGPQLASVFHCPSETTDDNNLDYDYWLNAELYGLHDVYVRYPSNTLLIGDGAPAGQTSLLGAEPDTSTNPASVAWDPDSEYATRHSGGANYAFVDGHVKWLQPSQINTEDVASSDNFAFRVKPDTP